MEINKIYLGDCIKVMKTFPDNCVDSIVTDPPYGLEFMGKEWDAPWKGKASKEFNEIEKGDMGGFTKLPNNSRVNNLKCLKCDKWKFSGSPCKCTEPQFPNARLMAMQEFQKWCELWAKECLRVLKPGGHLLSFGGTRTYHRMACAIEDAGFEVRDMVEWIYGSGFPKSLDIGKAIDKLQGNEREVVGNKPYTSPDIRSNNLMNSQGKERLQGVIDKGNSEWEGWGTALKPAHEPICMARKPLSESTVAANVLKHGTGGINIDESRIGTETMINEPGSTNPRIAMGDGWRKDAKPTVATGRFPANLIHDGSDVVLAEFAKAGESKSPKAYIRKSEREGGLFGIADGDGGTYGDEGTPARFFYTAKSSSSERNMLYGEEEFEQSTVGDGRPIAIDNAFQRGKTLRTNTHPTVKPVILMQYLIRLVTPPKGIVLDPFLGSGTTALAAKDSGFNWIGIEIDPDYSKIAEARLKQGVLNL